MITERSMCMTSLLCKEAMQEKKTQEKDKLQENREHEQRVIEYKRLTRKMFSLTHKS